MSLPAGLGRGDICDDATARVGALANADRGDISGQMKLLDRHSQAVAPCREDEEAAGLISLEPRRLEIFCVERFRINNGARHVAENQEFFCRQSEVVPIAGGAIGQHRLPVLESPYERFFKRCDHALFGEKLDSKVVENHGGSWVVICESAPRFDWNEAQTVSGQRELLRRVCPCTRRAR